MMVILMLGLTLIEIANGACTYIPINNCIAYDLNFWLGSCPCTTCMTGLVKELFSCCSPSVSNCKTCHDASGGYKCLDCYNGYILDINNSCIFDCDTALQLECEQPLLIGKICRSCNYGIANCFKCSNCNTCL